MEFEVYQIVLIAIFFVLLGINITGGFNGK